MTMATTSPWLAVAAGMLTVGAPCVLPMSSASILL